MTSVLVRVQDGLLLEQWTQLLTGRTQSASLPKAQIARAQVLPRPAHLGRKIRKITHLHTADGWTPIDLLPEFHPKQPEPIPNPSPVRSRRALTAAASPPPSGSASGLAVDVFLGDKLPLPQARAACDALHSGVVRMSCRGLLRRLSQLQRGTGREALPVGLALSGSLASCNWSSSYGP